MCQVSIGLDNISILSIVVTGASRIPVEGVRLHKEAINVFFCRTALWLIQKLAVIYAY